MMYPTAYLALLVLSAAACADDKEPAIDAGGGDPVDATPIDAPPSGPRNLKAVGAWTVSSHVTNCGGFDEGLVGSALTDDDDFLLVLNERYIDGSTVQTTCTFTSDTAFTCGNISKSATIGGGGGTCTVSGSFTSIQGTITGTAFEIGGDGMGNAIGSCPGGTQSCGPAVSSAVGTIAP